MDKIILGIIIGVIIVVGIVIYFFLNKKKPTINESKKALNELASAADSNKAMSEEKAHTLGDKVLENVKPSKETKEGVAKLVEASTKPVSSPATLPIADKINNELKKSAINEQKKILAESLPNKK